MSLLAAVLVATGCAPDDPPTGPSLAKGPAGVQFTVAPAALALQHPTGTGTAGITASAQYVTTVSSATSNASCATVSPQSVPTQKPRGSSLYLATFTVTANGPGTCTITLTDKKGNTATVEVTVTLILPDRIVYVSNAVNTNADIWVMDLDGTNKAPLVSTADSYEGSPSLSADGRFVLFSTSDGSGSVPSFVSIDGSGLVSLPLAGIWAGGSLSPNGGHIAYAAVVDGSPRIFRAELTGANLTQLTFPMTGSFSSETRPSWSGSGTGKIAYVQSSPRSIWIMNADGTGKVMVQADSDGLFHQTTELALSPDGQRIAFACHIASHERDICIVNANGTGFLRLTDAQFNDDFPRWTRDGRIIFTSNRDGNPEVYIMNADGTGQTNLTNSPARETTAPF